jgi:C-terminal processing protease CtpA/Prc
MRRTVLSFALASLLLCSASWAQPSKEELIREIQQKSRVIGELWGQKKIDQAVAVLEELRQTDGIKDLKDAWIGVLYNLACGYSLLGQKDRALSYLNEAVESGFDALGQVMRDSDLAAIRDDARFIPILAKLKMRAMAWDDPVFETQYRENLSAEEKLAGLSRVWAEVRYGFVYFDHVPTLNWDSLYVASIPKVLETKNTLEYYRVLQNMCSQLHDSHTGINVPGALFLELYSRPPVDTRYIDGKIFVGQVLDTSLTDSDILPGLEIVAVDGIPVLRYAEERVAPYHSWSTAQGYIVGTYEFYLLCGPDGSSVDIEFRDERGSTFRKTIARSYHRIQSFKKSLEFRLLDGNIAYVALNSFGDSQMVTQFDSLFSQIEKADALILDLRRNTGGNSNIGYDVLGYLTDKPFQTLADKVREYCSFDRAKGGGQDWREIPSAEWPANGEKLFSKPVVVLVGHQTGSAAEDFCVAFSALTRGKLIGSLTAGATGQPLFFSLPGGGTGLVCTTRASYPDGNEFVGKGIEPDVLFATTAEDVRTDRDAVLESAISTLKKTSGN